METLREFNRVHGATIIFITHDAIEAEKIIQRVGILRDGRLVALGRPQISSGRSISSCGWRFSLHPHRLHCPMG
ncbi:MAG: hypothetical protein R2856_17105 [Caldilineaceae bacterium]